MVCNVYTGQLQDPLKRFPPLHQHFSHKLK
nr:MAG TPA: hypothetical protein [Caudoviricetes sp.]